jgi:hypothetical protein
LKAILIVKIFLLNIFSQADKIKKVIKNKDDEQKTASKSTKVKYCEQQFEKIYFEIFFLCHNLFN